MHINNTSVPKNKQNIYEAKKATLKGWKVKNKNKKIHQTYKFEVCQENFISEA